MKTMETNPVRKSKLAANEKVQKLTFTALMAAILCILSPISIPLPSPMPAITLGTFAVYLSAYLLGPGYSCVSVFLYLLLGFVGLPVFSNHQAGIQMLAGATGGYLVGYFFLVTITGWFVNLFPRKVYLHVIGMILAAVPFYVLGTIWFARVLHLAPAAAISSAVLPFLIGDTIKIIAVAAIGYPMKKQLSRFLPVSSKAPAQ